MKKPLARTNIQIKGAALVLAAATPFMASCAREVAVTPGGGSFGEIEYVSVRDEPQHRHEFENSRVRIYDVLLPPGYATLYHAHTENTVYLVVHGSRLKSRAIAGDLSLPLALPVPSGMVFLNEHAREPLVHQVTNVGKDAARLVGIELKQSEVLNAREPISGRGLELKDTYEKVRVYRMELAPGENTGELDIPRSTLIVALSEATVAQTLPGTVTRIASFEPASWQWYEKPEKITFSNDGISVFEAILFEVL